MSERQQVELWTYQTTCKHEGCRDLASVIVRYVDAQGRPLRQIELCERHTVE